MKKSYILLLLLSLLSFGFYSGGGGGDVLLDQQNTFTEPQTFEGGIVTGPTDEDALIGLPRANQTGEEAGDYRIAFEGNNLVIQAMVNSSWTTIAWDATTKSFRLPQVYSVSGSDSFTLADEGVASIINEYEVAAADNFTMADAGSNTLDPGYSLDTDLTTPSTTVTVTSEATGYYEKAGAIANDTSTSQWWTAFTSISNQWIKIDFGSGTDYPINRVKIYPAWVESATSPPNASGCLDVKIEGSNNDTDWTTLVADSNNDMSAQQWYTIDYTNSTDYRYIRITVLSGVGTWYRGIAELELQVH